MPIRFEGAYPLYQQGRRLLVILLALYGVVLGVCVAVGAAAGMGRVPLMAIPFGLGALGGVVITAHLLVTGITPPQEMTQRTDTPAKGEGGIRVSSFDKVVFSMIGEEARPLRAMWPLAFMVLMLLLFWLLGFPI